MGIQGSDSIDDQGFESVGSVGCFKIEVDVDRELAESGLLELLAEWIKKTPTNKQMKSKFFGGEEMGHAKVEEVLNEIVIRAANGDPLRERAIRQFLEPYYAFFRREDINRLGLHLMFKHKIDGGPTEEVGEKVWSAIAAILGCSRVSQWIPVRTHEQMMELDDATEDAAEKGIREMRASFGGWTLPSYRSYGKKRQ